MKERYLLGFLLIFVLFSRVLTFEDSFQSYDSVNFALAADAYSIQDTRPQLPGYYLYVESIRSVNEFFGDRHTSMLFLSLIYSLLATAISYFVSRKWFGKAVSFWLVLMLASNPMVWYYGSVTEIYIFDWFFGVLILFTFLSKKDIFLSPIVLGAGMGIRPSSGIFLLPLYLFLWYKYLSINPGKLKTALLAQLGGVIVISIWLIPMMDSAGGLKSYLDLYSSHSPIPDLSLPQNLFQFSSYSIYLLFPFIVPLSEMILKKRAVQAYNELIKRRDLIKTILIWILPPLSFFVFFHYAKGYALLIIFGAFLLIGIALKRGVISKYSVYITILLQITFFIFFPKIYSPVEIFFAPENRNISNVNLWLYRTFDEHLLSYSKIKYRDESIKNIDSIIAKLHSHTSRDYVDKFLLDPTLSYYSRVMQIKHPGKFFYTFDLKEKGRFFVYHDIGIHDSFELKSAKGIVIITNKDFANEHLSSLFNLDIIAEAGNFSAYRIDEKAKAGLIEKYNELFLR